MSMESVVGSIRKVARAEARKIHVVELGEVTSVFPHSDDADKDYYQCNVTLKNRGVELRRVPVATPHKGLAHIPNTGDIVLVTFLNGEANSPVVIGCLYSDEEKPPKSKMGELVYKPSYGRQEGFRRVHLEFTGGMAVTITDDDMVARAGKTKITIKRDGDISIESEANVSIEAKGSAKVSSDGDLSLSASNIKVEGRQTVEIKAGANANIESTGPMKIKGAIVNIN